MTATRGDRVHSWVLQAGAGAIVAYWVEFYTSGRVRTSEDGDYVAFERAFLLADGYLAVSALLAARLLSRGRAEAVGAGIAAGSGAVFLGLMDLKYNVQQGNFALRTPAVRLEKAIVVATLGLGTFTMLRLWSIRHRLQG